MAMVGVERDKFMYPSDVAEYIWGIVSRTFS
jgi:hypothetical protein